MPEWTAFAGFVGVVLAGVLFLARLSADAVRDATRPDHPADPSSSARLDTQSPDIDDPTTRSARVPGSSDVARDPTAGTLLVDVLVSQGLFASILLAGVWLAAVPLATLGLSWETSTPATAAAGVVLGVALHAVNAVGSRLSDRHDLGDSTALRRAMTPDSLAGWGVLLIVVLPLVAGFEELLFRGVLIGGLATGFGVSPWLLAAGSSVAFALGHGAQGRLGILVTGVLGFGLAAAFVVTGSLLTVLIAHYLVNALEFLSGVWRD
jgi:membrane protease YdiL (CAAX protease family)